MTFAPGASNRRSRTTHVVVVDDALAAALPGAGNWERWEAPALRTAACGASVYASRGNLKPSNEVCKKCRRALAWPFIVSWESHGQTITTNFND
jgi:hypothetical protein